MDSYLDETRHLLPLPAGEVPTVSKMFHTRCPLCGPINDWTDTYADARRAAAAHRRDHERRAYVEFPIDAL